MAIDREQLIAQLIHHEGLLLKMYEDTVGKTTIGVGRNLTDVGISEDEAMYLLNNDIDACIQDLSSFTWFDELDPIRQRVLIDMRFNLGSAGFRRFRNTLAAVARGDYRTAAHGMLASKWSGQVKGRAVRLAHMMKTGSELVDV